MLEGPLAGGHLGFHAGQVDLAENTLERLLPPVKEVAMAHGDIPVVVAGGIYSMHVFFAERHMTGSDFVVETTIAEFDVCE